jgi:hypothetical protein
MTTQETRTLAVTIDAPFATVAADLAVPANHPEWGTEFFAGAARPGENGSVVVDVPMMGGPVRFKVESDVETGVFDLYLAPLGAPYGPPLPVRVVPNADGVDVLWTLARMPDTSDEQWQGGLDSMQRELVNLKRRHEQA